MYMYSTILLINHFYILKLLIQTNDFEILFLFKPPKPAVPPNPTGLAHNP
ncbi:hypothetical protein Hanom_Chr05g00409621 [Helianthus anomalus]